MLLVPNSSTTLTIDWRTPVRSEAMTMTTATPMTMPKTVRKLRNLCARKLSNAMRKISTGTYLDSLNFMTLFPRQRDDGVEAGSLERGVDAREQPDAARDADRQHDVDERHRHRPADEDGDEPRHPDRQQEAEDAAARRQERRLDEELQKHLLARRAQSLAQPDLEGALGHRDEHDVHHDDAADEERDGRDGDDHGRDAARQRVHLARDPLRVHDAEVVLLAPLELVLVPERGARVLDGGLERLARGRLAVNLDALAAAEDFAVGRQGD